MVNRSAKGAHGNDESNFRALGPDYVLTVFEIDGFTFVGVVIEGDLAGQIVGNIADGVEGSGAIGFGGNGLDETDVDFRSGRAEVYGDVIDFKHAIVVARIGRHPFADEIVRH